ncbi:hypothetical protein [Serratia marcescens]|uniref:hypothetical protein n=1 Tax=Serratia marcescens TaxID=615 RepID=UPI0027E5693D|nr:hypothetical protein [Serratia marcescens]
MTDRISQNNVEKMVSTSEDLQEITEAQSNSEALPQALPQADELKVRFKSGSIPLQTDFADLIDLANIGRQAVGGAKGQSGPANGFILSSTGRLELKYNDGKGIYIDQDGIAVKLEGSKGLQVTNNGMSVKAGDGIQINAQGVSIKLAADSGLIFDSQHGLKVKATEPVQVFHKGMVMMFAGTVDEIPTGWNLCDGSNGTPNLIDRFILGSKPTNSGKYNDAPLIGAGGEKKCNKKSSTVELSGGIDIEETKLTLDQLPKHHHNDGVCYFGAESVHDIRTSVEYGWEKVGFGNQHVQSVRAEIDFNSGSDYVAKTSEVGGGEGHTHTATMSATAHEHTTDVIPPYYTLAFIIKS